MMKVGIMIIFCCSMKGILNQHYMKIINCYPVKLFYNQIILLYLKQKPVIFRIIVITNISNKVIF